MPERKEPKRFVEMENRTQELSLRNKLMASEFVDLEEKYAEWFFEHDSFIEEYFVDQNFKNDLIANCPLPEQIKVECELIKSKYF